MSTRSGHETIGLLAALAALASCRSSAPPAEPGAAAIDAVLAKPRYANAHWGIHVEDLLTGEVLVARNSDRLFAPASNTKLFSVAAALEEFGAGQRFPTTLHRQGELSEDGSLRGELILRPTGDLTLGGRDDGRDGIAFTDSDHIYAAGNPDTVLTSASPTAGLRQLAQQVRAAGITSALDVVVDDRLFQRATSTGSGPRTVSPVLVNDNLIDFSIAPTTVGRPAAVDFRPRAEGYVVESTVQTVRGGDYGVRIESPKPWHFVLVGVIPEGHPEQIEVAEVHDPAANARMLLIEALRRAGVEVTAQAEDRNPVERLPISTGSLPVVARLQSPPFAAMAKLILKVSHNLHASALPLLIALRHGGDDLVTGLRWQGKLLQRIGVDVRQTAFGGAAGGDRADLATPRATVQLLRAVAARPYFQAFRDALPVLGVDGTLAKTGRGSPARGEVRAKTGTYYVYDAMNHRRLLTSKALAGYMFTAGRRDLAFSIVVNNVPISADVTPRTVGDDLAAIAAAIQQSR